MTWNHAKNDAFPKRRGAATGLVWHYCGAAVFGRRHDQRLEKSRLVLDEYTDPYADTLAWMYRTGRMGNHGGHYGISRDGERIPLVDPRRMVSHVSSAYRMRYNRWWDQRENRERVPEWFERFAEWPGENPRSAFAKCWQGPARMAGGMRFGPVNASTIAVEFVADASRPLTVAQLQTATVLAQELQCDGLLECNAHMGDHASVNPYTRASRDGSLWDVTLGQFEQLREAGLIVGARGQL